MERLLADAEKITGKKYDISNLADVYEAIHVIQKEYGITETTAKEAATTISGSWGMVKAAFKDWISGSAGGYRNFANSINAYLELMVNRLTELVPRLISQTGYIIKKVGAKLPELMQKIIPALKKAIRGLNSMLSSIMPTIVELISTLIPELLPAVIEGMAMLIAGVVPHLPKILKALWDGLKKTAVSLGKLIFGETEDGMIKWPTWKDVKQFFIRAWDGIKAGAASVMKLIFGETADGGIKWPDWKDVKAAFETSWNAIKAGAEKLMKLIFGENEEGGIKWPDWKEISTAFTDWWNNTFLPGAKQAMKWTLTIFGVPEETAEQVSTIIGDWWNTIKETAQKAIEWVLSLPSMPPHEAGEALRKIIIGWWEGLKKTWGNILSLLFGIGGPEDEDGTSTKEKIKAWWDEKVVPLLKGALDFVLGLFGLPDYKEMSKKISNWWEQVKSDVGTLFFDIIPRLLGLPGISENEKKASQLTVDDIPKYTNTNKRGGGRPFPSNAKGLNFVPYNDYLTRLHFGETVLSRNQAERYRRGEGQNQQIDYQGLFSGIRAAVRQGMEEANIMLDGERITENVNRRQADDIRSRRFAMA